MSKQRTIIVLGILVAIMPFLGFPIFWRKIFFLFSGIIIAVFAYKWDKEMQLLNTAREAELTSFKDNRELHQNKI